MSYDAFAFAYDQALGARFFQSLRTILDRALETHPPFSRSHLDVACGTGYVVEHFVHHGYRSTGLDASPTMLVVGRSRMRRSIAGDLLALPLRATFGCVTCFYDSLNHMLDPSALVGSFAAVRSVMDDRSFFFFDMNHPDIYPAVWGMREPFVSTGPDHHLEIATRYRRRERLGFARVTGWARVTGGSVVKIRELHEQRAWSQREITESLRAARLDVVDVLDFDPFREIADLDAGGVKLFYVCRRGN